MDTRGHPSVVGTKPNHWEAILKKQGRRIERAVRSMGSKGPWWQSSTSPVTTSTWLCGLAGKMLIQSQAPRPLLGCRGHIFMSLFLDLVLPVPATSLWHGPSERSGV